MYCNDEGRAGDARDRRNVLDEIEIELVVQRGVDRCDTLAWSNV